MDLVLNVADHYFLTPYIYPASWPEQDALRQILSLLIIVTVGGYLVYIIPAFLSYQLIYDKRLKSHPKFLPNQIKGEIQCAATSIPFMSLPTVALFFLEVRGYSKLYDNIQDTKLGWFGVLSSCITFILFTDAAIYWIHRFLHHKYFYHSLHKLHHKWKVPTPFASHAFHPLDGFLQSLPYHIYPFLFPLHKVTYLGLFMFVNIWTVSIHDGNYQVPNFLKSFINGSAHHMDHHLFYLYNYGQFFTLWDHMIGSYRAPSSLEGKGPMDEILQLQRTKNKNSDVISVEKTYTQNGHGLSHMDSAGWKKTE